MGQSSSTKSQSSSNKYNSKCYIFVGGHVLRCKEPVPQLRNRQRKISGSNKIQVVLQHPWGLYSQNPHKCQKLQIIKATVDLQNVTRGCIQKASHDLPIIQKASWSLLTGAPSFQKHQKTLLKGSSRHCESQGGHVQPPRDTEDLQGCGGLVHLILWICLDTANWPTSNPQMKRNHL